MPRPVHAVANAAAWAVFALLIGAAVLITQRLGFVGLIVLGGLTWLICLRAEMDDDTPTWSAHLFRSNMQQPGSPEQRAAMRAEQHTARSPLRFYRRCGMALTAIGVLGLASQWAVSAGSTP